MQALMVLPLASVALRSCMPDTECQASLQGSWAHQSLYWDGRCDLGPMAARNCIPATRG